MADSPIPSSVLAASGVVGAWAHDHAAGLLILSGRLADLFGLDPAAADRGVPLEVFLDRAHPEDRSRIENYFHAVAAVGGPVEAEFRIRDEGRGVRTLLLRGRVERDPSGHASRGCGIAIDRTDGQVGDLTEAEQVVNRMAEQVITLRGLAQSLQRPALVECVDSLMVEIGYELARFLPQPEDDVRH
jgi:PAS domain-containing protein